jgi:diaminohydroxyphosphoribosylaminopyrimidine deaminase / 5-amino-6-(5-phosphoribosylamino)uracil reductase
MTEKDKQYMLQTLRLARRRARPSSEPRAAALVVARDQVVGKGLSNSNNAASAIELGLDEAGRKAEGATLYTNIEPGLEDRDRRSSIKRIIDNRIARVVIGAATHFVEPDNDERAGALDPLRQAGIEVTTGVCEQKCRELNESFFKYSNTGLPFVTVKFASTLDGRIATRTGDSQWISGPASLRLAHQLRRENDGILVGIGTVLADNPRLTVRLVNGRDPLRIVIDSRLRIPVTARALQEGAAHHTLIATTDRADPMRIRELEDLGAEILILPEEVNRAGVNFIELFAALGRRRVASVLVEGGAGIITSLLAARLVDRLVIAIAPKIIGQGLEAIGDLGITSLAGALTFSSIKTRRLGDDIIFDGRLPV